ncbi:MAG TPA: tRNA lysidine(34) synthetase TilS, partial [Campylobacterales bacterium]|nr:tRNA lysidine(34) synthetase TilS [Campylobacterales bacterium]
MLEGVSLEALKGKKNLLAFSGGVDSTALFFLLMEADIE